MSEETLPTPEGSFTLGRFRETQPAMGQELQDTVPGSGSGDQ